MASARNEVIKGDYATWSVIKGYNSLYLHLIFNENSKDIYLNKNTVESYQVITEEQRKSGTSAVLRAGAGAFLFGGVGLLAGLSAKNKGTYLVAIQFKDGKQSLIEIDETRYKLLVQAMF
jgi:hypothetical protein